MNFLLDTHLLIWIAEESPKLSQAAISILHDEENEFFFSVVSLWELAIKYRSPRSDFVVEPRILRRNLIDNEFIEIVITSEHAINVKNLPQIHKDPFDRLLIAQATIEGITLLTSDAKVAQYPAPVRLV